MKSSWEKLKDNHGSTEKRRDKLIFYNKGFIKRSEK